MSKTASVENSSFEFRGIAALNIVYEAGTDQENRPILIICADNLPNPDVYDYDLILSYLLSKLEEFAKNDYVIVFFSSPARYHPGWLWLLKAYYSLDRGFKKNLKALYTVHLSKTYMLIFDLANKVISTKFASKLHYCSNLEQLKQQINIAPEFIPLKVIDYDRQQSELSTTLSEAKQSISTTSLAFGRSLVDLKNDENKSTDEFVPKFVIDIVNHLRENGLNEVGIFRKSAASDDLYFVKNAYNNGEKVDLRSYDIFVSAALLKAFIRELPNPLISLEFSESVGALPDSSICTKDTISRLKLKLNNEYKDLPMQFHLLKYIIQFLKEISDHSDKNKMNIHNLSIVFTPNIIRKADEETNSNSKAKFVGVPKTQEAALENAAAYLKQMNQGMSLVKLLISRYSDIFEA